MKLGEQVTFVVKTFMRPGKIHLFVRSAQEHFPDVPIIVVDDGDPQASEHKKFPKGVTVVTLPFDSGLSAGRNAGVDAVQTPYVVIVDDDFIVTTQLQLERAVEYMAKWDTLDVLGFRMQEGKRGPLNCAFWLSVKDSTCVKSRAFKRVEDHIPCHFILNCFLAKTAALRKHRWDPDLKVAEHPVFFWQHRDALKVALYMRGSFKHRGGGNPRYNKFKHRGKHFKNMWPAKVGFRHFMRANQLKRAHQQKLKIRYSGLDSVLAEHPIKYFAEHGPAEGHTLWTYFDGAPRGVYLPCIASLAKHNEHFRVVQRKDLQIFPGGEEVLEVLPKLKVEHQADLIRLLILKTFGGTWVDADCLAFRELDVAPLDKGLRVVVDQNGVCGSSPFQAAKGAEIDHAFCEALRISRSRIAGDRMRWSEACNQLYSRMLKDTVWQVESFPVDVYQPDRVSNGWNRFLRPKVVAQYLARKPDLIHLGAGKRCMPNKQAAALVGRHTGYGNLFRAALGINRLSRRQEIIARIPTGGHYVSVGVNLGQSDEVVLEARPDVTGTLVDTWGKRDDAYKRSNDTLARRSVARWNHVRRAALRRLAPFEKQTTICWMDSARASREFDGLADLVFIDANHSYAGVRNDIALWYAKVKSGGWLGGHDYGHQNKTWGVARAVQEFARAHDLLVELGNDMTWWVQKP